MKKQQKTVEGTEGVTKDWAKELERQFGPVIGGRSLWRLLGYPSTAAFRQARRRDCVPVKCITLPSRRGAFASTLEVARWIEATVETLAPEA